MKRVNRNRSRREPGGLGTGKALSLETKIEVNDMPEPVAWTKVNRVVVLSQTRGCVRTLALSKDFWEVLSLF